MKQFLRLAACVAALAGIFACNKLNEPQVNVLEDSAPVTKAAVDNAPILAVYVETNDVNPLNALDYLNLPEFLLEHLQRLQPALNH